MLRNYWAAAFTNLLRNRLSAVINVLSLSTGLTAVMLIALFMREELTYESFIPGHQDVFMVTCTVTLPGGHAPVEALWGESDVAAWLKSDIPAVAAAARFLPARLAVRHGSVDASEVVWWADPEAFSVLRLPVQAGNLETALRRPDGIVLTQSMARKYFGRDDPVGEALDLAQQRMTVTAVLKDLPSSTHLTVGIIASGLSQASRLSELDQMPLPSFGEKEWSSYTYVRLRSGAQSPQVERQLAALIDRHAPSGTNMRTSEVYHLGLLPISEIHLEAGARGAMKPSSRRGDLLTLGVIGVLILAIATLNFANLLAHRLASRAVEVACRKVAGAGQVDLLIQFVGESLLYVALAAALALAAAAALLPAVGGFLHRTIYLGAYWSDPAMAVSTVGFLLTLGLICGIYPSLVLARVQPAQILRSGGAVTIRRAGGLREVIAIGQLAVLIGLTVATLVIYRQAVFAATESLRLDSDQMLLVGGGCQGPFAEAVKQLRGVRAAACSQWAPPGTLESQAGVHVQNSDAEVVLSYGSVDFGFFELYGLKPLAGRFHERARASDVVSDVTSPQMTEPVVLNQAATRALGFGSPAAAVGKLMYWRHGVPSSRAFTPVHPSQIIGVVPDFQISSIREPIAPAAFYLNPGDNQILSLKLTGRDIPEALSAIDALWARTSGGTPIRRTFVDQLLQGKYVDLLNQAVMLAIFAGVTVVIACFGLLSLSVHVTERRRKEIGIRKALGAGRMGIVKLLTGDFARPILWANLLSWTVSFPLLTAWLSGFAYHADLQLWYFPLAGAAAAGFALTTVAWHTLAAVAQPPVLALRHE